MAGSFMSVMFLAPTLRDATARVPLATSLPSMLIGGVYSFTFLTMGMTFSALGAGAACSMWSLIALLRAPRSPFYTSSYTLSKREQFDLFVGDCRRWLDRQFRRADDVTQQYVSATDDYSASVEQSVQQSGGDHSRVAAGD